MKREQLNSELIKLSGKIIELYQQNSDPNYNSLIGEYQTLGNFGEYPIKLKENYLNKFEESHKVKFPNIINDILLNHGEHPLCHFFLESHSKSQLLEPTYIMRSELFKIFIANGVNIYDIEEFKSDYKNYYDPIYDKFNVEQMDRIYQEFKRNDTRCFDVILNTCQQVQVILNTEDKGKMVSTNSGDRLIKINNNDYYQPYYFVMNDTNEETIDEIHLEHMNTIIKRIEMKVENTITNIR